MLKIPSSNGFADQCGIAVGDLALAKNRRASVTPQLVPGPYFTTTRGRSTPPWVPRRSKMTTGETPIQPLGTGPCLEARDPPHTVLKS